MLSLEGSKAYLREILKFQPLLELAEKDRAAIQLAAFQQKTGQMKEKAKQEMSVNLTIFREEQMSGRAGKIEDCELILRNPNKEKPMDVITRIDELLESDGGEGTESQVHNQKRKEDSGSDNEDSTSKPPKTLKVQMEKSKKYSRSVQQFKNGSGRQPALENNPKALQFRLIMDCQKVVLHLPLGDYQVGDLEDVILQLRKTGHNIYIMNLDG